MIDKIAMPDSETLHAKRRFLFDFQDNIDYRREQFIAEIEGKLQQRVSQTQLFWFRWSLA